MTGGDLQVMTEGDGISDAAVQGAFPSKERSSIRTAAAAAGCSTALPCPHLQVVPAWVEQVLDALQIDLNH
jgi:hypothetical protein